MSEIDFYKKAKIIDETLTSGSITSDVFDLIKEKPYNDYFFNRVETVEWFLALYNEGYFKPDKNPYPIPADQEGYYSIPAWNVLPYLERVSQKVNVPGNEKYIYDLLAIIKDVTNFRDDSGNHIDNYRTWYYFTKILLNLPNEKITSEIINLIPIWLNSKFSTSLQGAEIAGKLLPKFLNSDNPEDWEKAERLIEIITDIKWLKVPEKKNIKEREEEARLIIEPHWLKAGFEKNFRRIGRVCSINVINTIAIKILDMFKRQYPYSYDVKYDNKDYRITHAFLEDGKHQISLHSLKAPEGLDEYSRADMGKKLLFSFDIPDFEDSTAFVANVRETLKEKKFPSLGNDFDKELSIIYSLHDYSYIWYESLYTSPEHLNIDDTEKLLTFILKEILAAKAQADKVEIAKVLEKFLSRKFQYPLFKRFVLYVVAKEWDEYKEYFFKIVKLKEIRWFEEPDYAVELSVLLKNNLSKFSLDEKEIIKNIIVTGPHFPPDENPEKYKAYWKQKWLSLMKDDPLFAHLFEEQKKLTGIEEDQFSFGTEFKTSSGFGPSPLSAEEILSLTGAELAIKLKEFRSEKKWEGQTVAAFSNALKDAVTINPNYFTENLNFFEDVGFIYIYKILDGLKDAWKAKKTIDWGKVFESITTYITKDQFWKNEYVVEPGTWLGGADRHWIVGMIAELIQEGTKDDSWAFPEEYFDKAKELIFILLRDTESDSEFNDYVFHVLNNPCGKLITALVYLALRIARSNDKKGIKNDPKWSDEYRLKFDELISQKVIDAYTSLGRFLPYLSYLDREWTENKARVLSSEKDSKYWVAFMEGYLSIGRVYDDLYEQMKPHYQYALSHEFREHHDREYLIHHICIGYLRGHEKLNDPGSLFRMIVDEWKPEQIREVIGFFWMQRDYLRVKAEENEEMKEKVIEFWRQFYDKYKGKDEVTLTSEDKQILSSASKLTSLLPKIDAESYKWLMLSAPHVHEGYNSSLFIEYLDELKDKGNINETAKYIGDVYLKVLEKITPDYDQKHIRSIVEFLYDAGATDIANRICNIYGSRGYEFLRDIYGKYNVSQ